MEHFVGLDVSQQETHACVLGSDGRVVWQGKCRSTPDAIVKAIKQHAPNAVKIGLETGPLSTWHWHAMNQLGLPVVCLDARHAKAVLNVRINKTDKNDAYGIAQIVRAGWFREVKVKSLDSHALRSMLRNRYQLVGMRVDVSNQIRGCLKTFGIILPTRTGVPFDVLVEARLSEDDEKPHDVTIRSLLRVYQSLKQQINELNRQLARIARNHAAASHLMTIPGVGTLTALVFVATIEDPRRFKKSRDVGAYTGLTPRRYQSGEVDYDGRISRSGDSLLRTYLYEAANVLLVRTTKWSALKAWGLRLAKKVGFKKATVAVARKLAVTMHAMWISGEAFQWSASKPVTS